MQGHVYLESRKGVGVGVVYFMHKNYAKVFCPLPVY